MCFCWRHDSSFSRHSLPYNLPSEPHTADLQNPRNRQNNIVISGFYWVRTELDMGHFTQPNQTKRSPLSATHGPTATHKHTEIIIHWYTNWLRSYYGKGCLLSFDPKSLTQPNAVDGMQSKIQLNPTHGWTQPMSISGLGEYMWYNTIIYTSGDFVWSKVGAIRWWRTWQRHSWTGRHIPDAVRDGRWHIGHHADIRYPHIGCSVSASLMCLSPTSSSSSFPSTATLVPDHPYLTVEVPATLQDIRPHYRTIVQPGSELAINNCSS